MIKKDFIALLKVELEDKLLGEIKVTNSVVQAIVDSLDAIIVQWLEQQRTDPKIDPILPFGKIGRFKIVEKKERKGVNPKTLEPIVIPQKTTFKFIPSQSSKELLQK